MNPKELIDRLTTDREWAQANEWESPICLQDDLSAAITMIATLAANIERLEQENRSLWELTYSQRNGLEQLRGELANYSQITEWLSVNGFESFEALVEAFIQVKRERDEYFEHLRGLCFCCGRRKDAGFDCRAKCYGHRRGSAWVYGGPQKEE